MNPLGRMAARGGAALLTRHALVTAVNFGATLALGWLLLPADFGVFALTLPPVTVLALLLDLGLGAALVRTPAARFPAAANAVFWWECGGAGAGAILLVLAAPVWRSLYPALPLGAERVLQLHALMLLGVPARTVAVARLERALDFPAVARLEVAEALAGQAAVLLCAWGGAGALALAAGPVARAVVGALGGPWLARWRPGAPRFDRPALAPLFAFGAPLQAGHLVTFGRDAALPLVVGAVAGQEAVGFVRWATSLANYPALLLLNVGRILFPLFSRVAHQRRALARAVQGALNISAWTMGLISVPLFALAAPLIRLAFPARWAPAVPLFAWLVPINLFLACLVPAAACWNALGRPGIRLAWAAGAGLVLWAGTLLTARTFGGVGFAASNLAMNVAETGLALSLLRHLPGTTLPARPLAAAVVCGAGLLAIVGPGEALTWAGLTGWGLAGTAAYAVLAGRPAWRA